MIKKLTAEQQSFFQFVADTAFTNPFSPQAEIRECKLIQSWQNSPAKNNTVAALLDIFQYQFTQLNSRGEFAFQDYPEEERKILEISWLFYQYRQYQNAFDIHIREQQKAGETPQPLTFTPSLKQAFRKAGYNVASTAKYIALFFQLRRGFYFISQGVYGESPSMVNLRMHLWNNLFTFNSEWYLNFLCEQMEDFSTLLLGETGTGKSLLAHAIGSSGFIPFDIDKETFRVSFTRAFQTTNLSQFPASLLESELFGHKKGAFTGAIENHEGLFSRCSSHGAVFIDEIGDIDIHTQVKLLNVIQDRYFCPVGSHSRTRFEGRVIAATNRDIEQMREQGLFRDDLYYRLCSDVVTIPSLYQRLQEQPEELILLIERIVARLFSTSDRQLTNNIVALIENNVPSNYHWPGNVRELEQCIRRICITGGYPVKMPHRPPQSAVTLSISQEMSVSDLLHTYCSTLYGKYQNLEKVARITGLDRRTVKKHLTGNLE